MTFSFNWDTQSKDNTKVAEAAATQYIKAKYGTTPAEFAKMVIKRQEVQGDEPPLEIQCHVNEENVAV